MKRDNNILEFILASPQEALFLDYIRISEMVYSFSDVLHVQNDQIFYIWSMGNQM